MFSPKITVKTSHKNVWPKASTTYAAFSKINVDAKEHETLCTGMLSANQFIHPA